HRFRVVQAPYNIVMPEAALAETQEGAPPDDEVAPAAPWDVRSPPRQPLFEAVADLGIAAVASATLMQSRLARALPFDLRGAYPNLRTDAQPALHFTRSTPGVTTALVGMRNVAHVRENLDIARIPPAVEAARRLLGR